MRVLIAIIALFVATPALAQDVGETVVLGTEIRSMRFSDADVTGPTFQEGEEATVLYVLGDRLRLRKADRYGWVSADVIAPTTDAVLPE